MVIIKDECDNTPHTLLSLWGNTIMVNYSKGIDHEYNNTIKCVGITFTQSIKCVQTKTKMLLFT